MIIHLPEDLDNFIRDQVHRGHFASEDDAIAEAVRLLQQSKRGTIPSAPKPPTEEEFKRQLLEAGLMTSLPTPADPGTRRVFQPIKIEGEPLSETIIRERR
jgi:Arc/MetJ-type ribon-helix-helix transcriptional regulator